MFIQTEQTPNPATLKFLPGKDVMGEGVVDFADESSAAGSPLARRLFAVDGVSGVHLGHDFISVTKSEMEDWYLLKPAILGAIMDHYMSGDPVIEDGADLPEDVQIDENDETVKQIKELIETRVRPAVAQDGGHAMRLDVPNTLKQPFDATEPLELDLAVGDARNVRSPLDVGQRDRLVHIQFIDQRIGIVKVKYRILNRLGRTQGRVAEARNRPH